jgi:hypothetical protein
MRRNLQFLAGIAAVALAAGAAHAHEVGQTVTANRPALACKSWNTIVRLVGMMKDDAAFAAFLREQGRTGECRTIAKGQQVVVEQESRSVDPKGEERAKMCGRPVGEKQCWWTYPGWFD